MLHAHVNTALSLSSRRSTLFCSLYPVQRCNPFPRCTGCVFLLCIWRTDNIFCCQLLSCADMGTHTRTVCGLLPHPPTHTPSHNRVWHTSLVLASAGRPPFFPSLPLFLSFIKIINKILSYPDPSSSLAPRIDPFIKHIFPCSLLQWMAPHFFSSKEISLVRTWASVCL